MKWVHVACCQVVPFADQHPSSASSGLVEVGHEHSFSAYFDVFEDRMGYSDVIQDGEVCDVTGIDDVDDFVTWPDRSANQAKDTEIIRPSVDYVIYASTPQLPSYSSVSSLISQFKKSG